MLRNLDSDGKTEPLVCLPLQVLRRIANNPRKWRYHLLVLRCFLPATPRFSCEAKLKVAPGSEKPKTLALSLSQQEHGCAFKLPQICIMLILYTSDSEGRHRTAMVSISPPIEREEKVCKTTDYDQCKTFERYHRLWAQG